MAISNISNLLTNTTSITASTSRSALEVEELGKFTDLLQKNYSDDNTSLVKNKNNGESLSSSQILKDGRLPGDIINSSRDRSVLSDTHARPQGAGVSSIKADKITIDKTSKLYEKSQELETFFMKILLSSMRATVSKTNLSGEENSFASKMYDDMMYDQFATSMTKNAGFGLADQIYLQLNGENS